MKSVKIDFRLSFVYNGRVKQCSVYPWMHNLDPIKDCGKCRNFIKVVPLHPYIALECHDRPEQPI